MGKNKYKEEDLPGGFGAGLEGLAEEVESKLTQAKSAAPTVTLPSPGGALAQAKDKAQELLAKGKQLSPAAQLQLQATLDAAAKQGHGLAKGIREMVHKVTGTLEVKPEAFAKAMRVYIDDKAAALDGGR